MKRLLILLGVATILSSLPHLSAKDYRFGLPSEPKYAIPDPGNEVKQILKKYNAFYIGNTNIKEVYLTFDAGYEIGNTSFILDILKKRNVRAAFFITGHFIKEHPDLVKRMAMEGHIVGNHTWGHPDLTKATKEDINKELEKIEIEYQKITGKEMMKFLRPPRGTFSDNSLKETDNLGYINIFWSLAYVDWYTDRQQGWQYAYEIVTKRIHNGAIILLHTVSTDNKDALDKIILDLENEGYQFKSIENLIFN